MNEYESRWDGMRDGDEETVELPFGEAVFTLDKGDPSVGINGGVYVSALVIGGADFSRDQLEKIKAHAGGVKVSLAEVLDSWAATQ